MRDIDVSPDGTIVFSTTSNIFLSNDDGETWSEIHEGRPNNEFSDVVIDKNNNIYANPFGNAILSSDLGQTWVELSEITNLDVLSTDSSGVTFASVAVLGGISRLGVGVFRTIDAGNTWEEIAFSTDIGISGGNTRFQSQIRAVMSNGAGEIFVATSRAGVYRSLDDGGNWEPVSNGLPQSSNETYSTVTSLLFDAEGNILAGTSEGLFRSADNGDSWGGVAFVEAGGFVTILTRDSKGNLYAAAGNELLKSEDNGVTWEDKSYPNGTGMLDLKAAPSGKLLAGMSKEGILVSENEASNWIQPEQGFVATGISDLVWSQSGTLYAAAGRRIFLSEDKGVTWSEVYKGAIGVDVNVLLAKGDNLLFAGTDDRAIRTTDKGVTWDDILTTGTTEEVGSGVVNTNGDIYLGVSSTNGGVYRSSDDGDSWDLVIDNPFVNAPSYGAFAATNNGVVFVGTQLIGVAGKLFRTLDHGETWSQVVLPDSISTPIWSIATYDSSLVYIGTSRGIFKSADNGETVVPTEFTGLVGDLVVNSDRNVLAATPSNGVFRSRDGSTNWEDVSEGMPAKRVSSLLLVEDDFMYAGSWNAGVFKSNNPTIISVENLPTTASETHLYPNYPNPFNTSTTVPYALNDAASVSIIVYDILGRTLKTLETGVKTAGSHEVFWNGTDESGHRVASGVYFYQLQVSPTHGSLTESYSVTKSLVIMR